MPRTRSTKTTAPDSQESDSTYNPSTKSPLVPCSGMVPKLFVLPRKATKEAKIVTFPHPRHGKPSRFLVCPETGFYEFTHLSAPKSTPRSWLLETDARARAEDTGAGNRSTSGQVVCNADFFVATTMDPMFLLLPALADSNTIDPSPDQKRLFLSSDDYYDRLPEEASHMAEVLPWEKTRSLLEARMASICDTVDAGDETMYRLSRSKVVAACLQKARTLAEANALPPSFEKQFVGKALQAPLLNKKRTQLAKPAQPLNDVSDSGQSTPQTESNDSQSTTESTETAATSVDGENSEVELAIKPSQEIIDLQKLRVAFDLICERLVSPAVTKWLKEGLSEKEVGNISFAPLDEYLGKLAELQSEAQAARSMGEYTRKHMRDEDEEEAREQKRRKTEEEKKRKANESRGVKDLKKVNTSGMKKLSHFFQKK